MSQIVISKNDVMMQRVKDLVNNLSILSDTTDTINLTDVKWITPLSILPLAYKISKIKSQHKINIIYPEDKNIKSYLKTILFPEGTNNPFLITYGKTYLPIVRIKTNKKSLGTQTTIDVSVDKYEKIMLENLFINQTHKNNISQALRQFIAEMTDNVQDHSMANEFWILSQCWNKSGELEICLLDDGIGLKKSYENANIPVKDDIDAISKAIEGISAKKLYGDSFGERGTGIRNSINLLTRSDLRGEITIMSGSVGYYAKYGQNPILFKIPNCKWQGVLIVTRICKPLTHINIYDYIE